MGIERVKGAGRGNGEGTCKGREQKNAFRFGPVKDRVSACIAF